MSPHGRPKGSYRSAQHEGTPVSPLGRPKGSYRSAQHEGTPMSVDANPDTRLNPGTALDLARVRAARVNQPAVARRVSSLNASRSVKKNYQAAWLVKALQCIDLTTLAGDDTPGRVRRLCAKARQPLRADLLQALGLPAQQVGAVCVYHEMVATAVAQLAGSGIPVAAVSTGFTKSAWRPSPCPRPSAPCRRRCCAWRAPAWAMAARRSCAA